MPSGGLRLGGCLALVIATQSALAGCPDNKSTVVFNSSQGGSYLFYYLQGERTIRFTAEGKSFRMDTERVPGHALYEIDDKILQVDRVDRKSFASFAHGNGEAQTLDAQARYEQDYVRRMLPDARIKELGLRARTNRDGKSTQLFRIWRFQKPEMQAQYVMTTLLDADTIIMISASLPGNEANALAALRSYASSLERVSAEDCDRIQWP